MIQCYVGWERMEKNSRCKVSKPWTASVIDAKAFTCAVHEPKDGRLCKTCTKNYLLSKDKLTCSGQVVAAGAAVHAGGLVCKTHVPTDGKLCSTANPGYTIDKGAATCSVTTPIANCDKHNVDDGRLCDSCKLPATTYLAVDKKTCYRCTASATLIGGNGYTCIVRVGSAPKFKIYSPPQGTNANMMIEIGKLSGDGKASTSLAAASFTVTTKSVKLKTWDDKANKQGADITAIRVEGTATNIKLTGKGGLSVSKVVVGTFFFKDDAMLLNGAEKVKILAGSFKFDVMMADFPFSDSSATVSLPITIKSKANAKTVPAKSGIAGQTTVQLSGPRAGQGLSQHAGHRNHQLRQSLRGQQGR